MTTAEWWQHLRYRVYEKDSNKENGLVTVLCWGLSLPARSQGFGGDCSDDMLLHKQEASCDDELRFAEFEPKVIGLLIVVEAGTRLCQKANDQLSHATLRAQQS